MRRCIPVLAAVLLGGCESEVADTYSGLDPMIRQDKFAAYTEADFFDDGKAMRDPPEGTVPYGAEYLSGAVATGREGGAYVAEIPMPVTRDLLERGRNRFEITCATCHGLLGDGESLVAANMALRPPPSLLAHAAHPHPPGYYFVVATEGYGLMPGYASELGVRDRWAVVAYLQALQLSQSARLEDAPPEVREALLGQPVPGGRGSGP